MEANVFYIAIDWNMFEDLKKVNAPAKKIDDTRFSFR
jgi:hypothetical protein